METIVEFRAGLMALADGRLAADPRKGLLRVAQDEAGLTHLLWYERDAAGGAAAAPEKDVVIFPGESSFGKVGARPWVVAGWPAASSPGVAAAGALASTCAQCRSRVQGLQQPARWPHPAAAAVPPRTTLRADPAPRLARL